VGGLDLSLDNRDVRALIGLKTLLADAPPDVHAWLLARWPASNLEIFRRTLGDDGDNGEGGPDGERYRAPPPPGLGATSHGR
jgi:hypothetical protein